MNRSGITCERLAAIGLPDPDENGLSHARCAGRRRVAASTIRSVGSRDRRSRTAGRSPRSQRHRHRSSVSQNSTAPRGFWRLTNVVRGRSRPVGAAGGRLFDCYLGIATSSPAWTAAARRDRLSGTSKPSSEPIASSPRERSARSGARRYVSFAQPGRGTNHGASRSLSTARRGRFQAFPADAFTLFPSALAAIRGLQIDGLDDLQDFASIRPKPSAIGIIGPSEKRLKSAAASTPLRPRSPVWPTSSPSAGS